jgi:hypothetical protein
MVKGIVVIINLLSKPVGWIAGKRVEQYAVNALYGITYNYSWSNILRLNKQFNCETGNGTDYKFLEHNNAWGMMVPSWSEYQQGAIGTEGQAIYRNLSEATYDRFHWDSRNGITGREENYLQAVQALGYNPSEMYSELVEGYENGSYSTVLVLAGIPAIIIGTLFIFKNLR